MKILKVREGKENVLRDWGRQLTTTYATEARVALKEEHVSREWFYLFEVDGEYYVAAHMEGDGFVPPNADRAVNRRHRDIMKACFEGALDLEELYDIAA